MAYRLGALLHHHFGYTLVNVRVEKEKNLIFDYDTPFESIDLPQLDRQITADDLLVANPSFSQLLFGFRLPARKIMYVQGVTTYSSLDGHFDLYVSASHVIQHYLSALWGIHSQIIPPFIQIDKKKDDIPWRERPPGSVLVYLKHPSSDCRILHDYLIRALKERLPEHVLTNVIGGKNDSS